VGSTLRTPPVDRVLAGLVRRAQNEDPPAIARMRAHEEQLGRRVYGRERGAVYGLAPLSITPEVGELLYVLAIARRSGTIVEFGASLGFSTIHLAAAARDLGGARVITTEMEHEKARLARQNLAEAGLDDLVDLREGDALTTLADVDEVDLLFLDGWNNLYLPVLDLLEPSLSAGALVVADLSAGDPEQDPYCARMHGPSSGYVSVDVPLDAGVVVSVRV
jgi:predicted O-methyltransferase YrrM